METRFETAKDRDGYIAGLPGQSEAAVCRNCTHKGENKLEHEECLLCPLRARYRGKMSPQEDMTRDVSFESKNKLGPDYNRDHWKKYCRKGGPAYKLAAKGKTWAAINAAHPSGFAPQTVARQMLKVHPDLVKKRRAMK